MLRDDVGVLALAHDLGFFVLVANFADDLFHQIFDRDQARDASYSFHQRSPCECCCAASRQQMLLYSLLRERSKHPAHQRVHVRCEPRCRAPGEVLRVQNPRML